MKKYLNSMVLTRLIFVFIAFASILSMAINTWDIHTFIRYFSISSNMIIVFVMLYLAIFFPSIRENKVKPLANYMIWGVLIYLILWNGIPFTLALIQNGVTGLAVKSGLSPIVFILLSSLQILIVPLVLYCLLRFEVNAAFKKKQDHLWIHLLILGLIVSGVWFLVIQAL